MILVFFLLLDVFQLIKYHIVDDLDIRSLHTGGTGFNDTGALELAQGIDDHGTGNAHPVCDLAGNEDAFLAVQLVKNMDDGLQLGEGQRADGRFYNLDLPILLCVLLIHGAHHLEADHRRAILT